MKAEFVRMVALVVLLVAPFTARADDQKDIAKQCNRWSQAVQHKQPQALLALETPDFKARPTGARTYITGAQLAQLMKQDDALVGTVHKMDTKLSGYYLRGRFGSVTAAYTYVADLAPHGAKTSKAGKGHQLTITGMNFFSLIKGPTGWKIQALQTGFTKAKVDGKPVKLSDLGFQSPTP